MSQLLHGPRDFPLSQILLKFYSLFYVCLQILYKSISCKVMINFLQIEFLSKISFFYNRSFRPNRKLYTIPGLVYLLQLVQCDPSDFCWHLSPKENVLTVQAMSSHNQFPRPPFSV